MVMVIYPRIKLP